MPNEEQLVTMRHSLSHILAMAVQKLHPGTRLGIGPAIDTGFYYDFSLPDHLSDEDLTAIETEMKTLCAAKLSFTREEMTIDAAKKLFSEKKEEFKVELIDELAAAGESTVSIYHTGDWLDLCKGPHVSNTSEILLTGFKLDRVSGAYWKGDEKRPMLQRIYALHFNAKKELDEYLKAREEARNRDHRKLGRELGLFMISDVVGKGLPMLLPKGATMRRILERWTVDEELKRGYSHVYTPVLGGVELYKISGHWDHYRESMYSPVDIDGELFVLRPMTCPHHFMMYKNDKHSYRELPIRYAEISPLYRYEKSGELTGLIRLRNFTLADAHIMCRPEQLKSEFSAVIKLVQYFMEKLGIAEKAWYRASLRDKVNTAKYIDNDAGWDESEKIMTGILDELELPYVIAPGEAAFYGPKIDVQLKNAHGKDETAFTIQIDFALAERFDLTYTDSDGSEKRPWIIHRSSIGCFERTMAFLIEHYAGKFPLWLSPVQADFIPVAERHNEYVESVMARFNEAGLRTGANMTDETVGKKIALARSMKVPYAIVVGDKEVADGTVTVRNRDTQAQKIYTVEEAIRAMTAEDADKTNILGL